MAETRATVYDKRGIPIMRGDVVKVFHFTGARRKRNYMYKQCLGLRSFREGGSEYVFFSHLNFVTETSERDGPYHEYPGKVLPYYEIVQSIECDHEHRTRLSREALRQAGEGK